MKMENISTADGVVQGHVIQSVRVHHSVSNSVNPVAVFDVLGSKIVKPRGARDSVASSKDHPTKFRLTAEPGVKLFRI